MKKLYLFIICAAILFLMPSCKKEEEMSAYTITGTLRENCGSPPLTNAYLELFQDAPSGFGKSQTLYTYTDGNGKFTFTYKSTSIGSLSLFYGTPASSTRILNMASEKNLNLGDIYINNKVTIIIKFKPISQYSSLDTLYYGVGHIVGNYYKIGPFYSEMFDTLYANNGYTMGGNSYGADEQTALYWGMGWNDYYQALLNWNSNSPYHKIPFKTRGNCMVDSVELVIQ